MAVVRQVPKCEYCGKAIAKGVYKNYDRLPFQLRPIGDSFLYWKYKKCKCKGARKERRNLRKNQRTHGLKLTNK